MRRRCSILVFCVLLGFGVCLAVPAEDVPETAYDESEGLPYEGTPLFSIVVPLVAARTTQAVPSSSHPRLGAPSLFAAARVRDIDANRATDTRISLALLCILLC
jgi:hypothetical protein